MTQMRRDSFSFPFEAPTLSAPSAAGDRRERWPDRDDLRQREVTERRARGTLPFPPRRARWPGRLALTVLVLCAATAVGVVTLRPQWVPHPSRMALARVRGSVLDLLGRRMVLAAPTAARVSVPPRAVPADVAPPAQVHGAPPPSVSDVPVVLVSALPVAGADWRDPSKAAAHAKAATHAAPTRTRHAWHAVPRRAVGVRPTPDDATRTGVQAAAQPAPVAAGAPAPAPGSLDDLIRKSVQADAKKPLEPRK
jgi:hypothetical protein